MSTSFRPLDGVRIIEFSTSIAGPAATMILAQLGADVIKVESPNGDDARAWPPHVEEQSIVFRQMNVGKRGIVVDLKQTQGVEVALALTDSAAVVLQTMRPGVADRIGIGEDAVRARNAEIIYFDMNAFGTGPLGSDMPGYDPMIQAFTGIMAMTGHDDAPPTRCAPSLIDLGTGQWIAMGVLAAVLAKQRGQPVKKMETALVDTGFNVVSYQASTALTSGERPPRAGSGNPIAAPYQCFTAKDGELRTATDVVPMHKTRCHACFQKGMGKMSPNQFSRNMGVDSTIIRVAKPHGKRSKLRASSGWASVRVGEWAGERVGDLT